METAIKVEKTKTCLRCKNPFVCKVEDIKNCACNSIKLNKNHRQYLANYGDCICIDCLKFIASQKTL